MSTETCVILGVGNILEKDDGVAVYATAFLERNYTFEPPVRIINGGVEGINLLSLFMEHPHILILDAIGIDDAPGSIYHIPASELTGFGINSGGAHEVGVLQCLDMLELMARPLPRASIVGIVPGEVTVQIGLTPCLQERFDAYIETVLRLLETEGVVVRPKEKKQFLPEIIEGFADQRT